METNPCFADENGLYVSREFPRHAHIYFRIFLAVIADENEFIILEIQENGPYFFFFMKSGPNGCFIPEQVFQFKVRPQEQGAVGKSMMLHELVDHRIEIGFAVGNIKNFHVLPGKVPVKCSHIRYRLSAERIFY